MGHALKSQSIDVQNRTNTPFNNMKLVWRKYVRHGGAHMVEVPHEQIPKFLEGECGHGELVMDWNMYKWVPHKQMLR